MFFSYLCMGYDIGIQGQLKRCEYHRKVTIFWYESYKNGDWLIFFQVTNEPMSVFSPFKLCIQNYSCFIRMPKKKKKRLKKMDQSNANRKMRSLFLWKFFLRNSSLDSEISYPCPCSLSGINIEKSNLLHTKTSMHFYGLDELSYNSTSNFCLWPLIKPWVSDI